MSIRELPDGRWRVQVDIGRTYQGKRRRRVKTCDTLREARKTERSFELERLQNDGNAGHVKLTDFIRDTWLPEREATCRYDTVRNYRTQIARHVLPSLGNMYVFWWQSDPDEYGVSVTDMLDMTHSMRKA